MREVVNLVARSGTLYGDTMGKIETLRMFILYCNYRAYLYTTSMETMCSEMKVTELSKDPYMYTVATEVIRAEPGDTSIYTLEYYNEYQYTYEYYTKFKEAFSRYEWHKECGHEVNISEAQLSR